MTKKIAWSYSGLTAFEQCPRQYYHYRIAKDFKDVGSDMSNYGTEAHKHFENRLLKSKKLPLDLQHHEKNLAKLASASGDKYPEQKLAITADFEPTGWFDSDVWCRAIVDFMVINGTHAVIFDHKFGKLKEGFDQIELCCAMIACYMPDLETFTGAYYWAKEKKITRENLTREDLPGIWNNFMPRVKQMQKMIVTDNFPARPSGLCRRYCHVKSCEHCGV